MDKSINIYCDESCHLEHNRDDVMVIGAVWCRFERAKAINGDLRAIVRAHGLGDNFEVKWVKVSPGQSSMYLALIDYFFDNPDLHFRALVVSDKTKINHAAFEQTHDEWYYKMYFRMLEGILDPQAVTRIFLDYKDTQGGKKTAKLHEILCNSCYDFSRQTIRQVQIVQSHEVPLIQLADLMIGSIGYANRGLTTNAAKVALVSRMRQRSGYALDKTTLLREPKVNILCWQPSGSLP